MKKLRTRMLLFALLPILLFFGGMIIYVSPSVQNMAVKDYLATVIHTYSEQATASMDDNEKEVNEGSKKMTDVGNVFAHMISFVQEVVIEIQELSALAEQMSSITEEITATSEDIASSAEKSSGHTQQVAAAAEQQLATMEEMTLASENLKNLAQEVDQLLRQFKVS